MTKTANKTASTSRPSRGALDSAFTIIYRLRKVIMALPVAFYAFKLAIYNGMHLPVEVGLFLQNNGDFLFMVDRNVAVLFPLLVTFGCLTLMMFSRKAMYAWVISIFTLTLPLLLLISNIYPY